MRIEHVFWDKPMPYETAGETFDVIYSAEYTNVHFMFGVPTSYNTLHESEKGFIQIHAKDQDKVQVMLFDQNELVDMLMGLSFIINAQLRTEGLELERTVESPEGQDAA